jgi:hypothetical protein
MTAGMSSIAWNEIPHVWRRLAPSLRAGLVNLLCIAAVSYGVPWLVGLSFLDPLSVIPFACLSAFFSAILVPPMFAGKDSHAHISGLRADGNSVSSILAGKLLAAIVSSWLIGAAVLVLTLVTVNIMNWHGTVLMPEWDILTAALLASAATSTITAVWSALVATLSREPGEAKRAMRVRMMFLTLGCVLLPAYIPSGWTQWFSADLTNSGIIRKTVAMSAAVFALAAILALRARSRVDQWSATPPSPNTYLGRLTGL